MKWLLAIPHYVVLFFLGLALLVVIVAAWFAILLSGRYPGASSATPRGSSAGNVQVTATL